MKKISMALLCIVATVWALSSCSHKHNNGNISLSVSESGQYYKLSASFDEDRTFFLEEYMNRTLGNGNNISFKHTVMDADITLDNGTTFYIKKDPGRLKIKFNKNANSIGSYKKMKHFTEGLKEVLSDVN